MKACRRRLLGLAWVRRAAPRRQRARSTRGAVSSKASILLSAMSSYDNTSDDGGAVLMDSEMKVWWCRWLWKKRSWRKRSFSRQQTSARFDQAQPAPLYLLAAPHASDAATKRSERVHIAVMPTVMVRVSCQPEYSIRSLLAHRRPGSVSKRYRECPRQLPALTYLLHRW